jgi:hypothetical protein
VNSLSLSEFLKSFNWIYEIQNWKHLYPTNGPNWLQPIGLMCRRPAVLWSAHGRGGPSMLGRALGLSPVLSGRQQGTAARRQRCGQDGEVWLHRQGRQRDGSAYRGVGLGKRGRVLTVRPLGRWEVEAVTAFWWPVPGSNGELSPSDEGGMLDDPILRVPAWGSHQRRKRHGAP